jgi:hypothetical protein
MTISVHKTTLQVNRQWRMPTGGHGASSFKSGVFADRVRGRATEFREWLVRGLKRAHRRREDYDIPR